MARPTCDHTMDSLGYGWYHCPRCGTAKFADDVYVPKLVTRCREFEKSLTGHCAVHMYEWHVLGIDESINVPSGRKETP